jgi:hypothetical protein
MTLSREHADAEHRRVQRGHDVVLTPLDVELQQIDVIITELGQQWLELATRHLDLPVGVVEARGRE